METTPKEKADTLLRKAQRASPGTMFQLPPGISISDTRLPKQTLTDIERTQLVIDALSGIRSDERLSRIICGAFALKGKARLAASIQGAMRACALMYTTPKQRKVGVDELKAGFPDQERKQDK